MTETVLNPATRKKDCIARRVRGAYLFGLALIASIVIGIFLMERHTTATLARSAEVINISGQQRMLSQRVALYAKGFANPMQASDEADTIRDLRVRFAFNHRTIMQLDELDDRLITPEIAKIYFGGKYAVDLRTQEFLNDIDALLNSPAGERNAIAGRIVEAAKTTLPGPLNAAVLQFEADALADVRSSKRIQLIMLIVMLHTIVAELLLIFRPMARQVVSRTHELEQARLESLHAAMHDALTDLPNRRYLKDVLVNAQAAAAQNKQPLTICQIDLDRFKFINDTLGHSIGDAVLERVALILRETTRDSDFIARTGGDEFVIVDCEIGGAKDARTMAQRIVDAINQPMVIEGRVIEIGASIGIAEFATHDTDIDAVLGRADIALYQAKDLGRGRVCIFTQDAQVSFEKRATAVA